MPQSDFSRRPGSIKTAGDTHDVMPDAGIFPELRGGASRKLTAR